jgi:transposase
MAAGCIRPPRGPEAGPAACGYEDQCWTLARIAEEVWQRFGAEYTLAGMDVLLHRIGRSVQVPARRAAERDEAAIARWREKPWPGVGDGGGPGRLAGLGGRVRPGSEAAGGPHLGPARTDPSGDGDRRQQQAEVAGRADRRQAGAAAPADLPGPHTRRRGEKRGGFTEKEYARLLDAAHAQLAGPVVLLRDNLNAHVSGVMAELVAARDWLTVYRLPPYAHELNPVEPAWPVLKKSLANLVKHNISELSALAKTRLRRMQYRPASSRAPSPEPGSTSHPSATTPELKIGQTSCMPSRRRKLGIGC